MPCLLEGLVIDRVDLVDEGANSAAAITLFKRKEQNQAMGIKEILEKMKPEHAAIIQEELDRLNADVTKSAEVVTERDTLKSANEKLTKANEDLTKANNALDAEIKKHKGDAAAEPSMEEIMKNLSPEVREFITKLNDQKVAAEVAVRKAAEAEAEATAVAKAATLKALPLEQSKLVGIIKGASPEILELLTTLNAAMESTALGEVGKASPNGGGKNPAADAWAKIEKKADEIVKTDKVSKAKAISMAVEQNPDLYKEYLEGGAN